MSGQVTQDADLVDGQHRVGPRELIALVSATMAFIAVGIDLMLPAFDDIRDEFGLGGAGSQTSRVVTVYFYGMAIGQLFYGPLADRFGRKRALYAAAAVYIGGAFLSAVAPSFNTLLAGRFVWGLGAAGGRVVAVAIVRDRFSGAAMAKAMSNVMAVFVLVPIIAPSLGAVIIAIAPWRTVFWFCMVFAMVVVVWSLRLRETLRPQDQRKLNPRAIAAGYWQVARTPVTFGYTVAAVFIQGAFTAYIASIELVIGTIYDRESQFPVIFGVVAVLFGVAAIVNGRVVERLGINRVVDRALLMQGVLGVGLAVFVSFDGDAPNIWLFLPLLGVTLSISMFLMPNLGSAAMEPLGEIAGSGSALTGAARVFLGALIGGLFAERVTDSVMPLVVATLSMWTLTTLTVWLTRRGGVRQFLGGGPVTATASR